MEDRSNDQLHHERTFYHRATSHSPERNRYMYVHVCVCVCVCECVCMCVHVCMHVVFICLSISFVSPNSLLFHSIAHTFSKPLVLKSVHQFIYLLLKLKKSCSHIKFIYIYNQIILPLPQPALTTFSKTIPNNDSHIHMCV